VRAGLAIAPGPLTVIPVAALTGRLAARFGHLIDGVLLYAAAALWFMLVPVSQQRWGASPTSAGCEA